MGMYDTARSMERKPAEKAVSAKNAQPEPGKPEVVEGGDEGFAADMKEHHTHQAGHHREQADYHDGKAGEY